MAKLIMLKSKVLAALICVVLSFCFLYTVSAQSTVVSASASNNQPAVGSTLTVTLYISNVQNLFGLDANLRWSPSVLSLSSVALNVGDSHSNGVLHGRINRDYNTINFGDLYVNETKVSGSYDLIAQSIGQTTSSFTGSGTIATLTFNVISTGLAGLTLTTDLADKALSGQNANNIAHQDTASSVIAIASSSTSTPSASTTPTSSATPLSSSTPASSTSPTPTVPEFSNLIIITLLIALAIIVAIIASRKLNKIVPSYTFLRTN
jgi:hypothetical protein